MMDSLIREFDKALRAVFVPARSVRPVPGATLAEASLLDDQKRLAIGLMRVNHCGEICAQALYQGQALTSADVTIRQALQTAADEETEHLAWTEGRIKELGGRTSWLNPLWYGGSLAIGILVGKLGDGWNLGFLAETERQVEAHLDGHLRRLPEADRRSWAIVEQMKTDEIEHARTAERLGAHDLPIPAKLFMKLASGTMTRVAYWI